jgi:hypothetical protein
VLADVLKLLHVLALPVGARVVRYLSDADATHHITRARS